MFDTVLERSLPQRPLVASALVAVGIHALLIPSAFLLPRRTAAARVRDASADEVQVTFLSRAPASWEARPAPSEAPEALGSVAVTTGARPRVGKSKPLPSIAAAATVASRAPSASPEPALTAVVAPLTTASETHVAASASAAMASHSAQPANGHPVGGGDRLAGAHGAAGGGEGTGAHGSGGGSGSSAAVLPFGAGMTRPVLLSKRDPTYTREALAARVEGSMLLKCVITTAGSLRGCRVIKGLPYMDDAVLRALSEWRYTPVTYQGQPVSVDYVIPVRLVLP